jgi:hypothetical protein
MKVAGMTMFMATFALVSAGGGGAAEAPRGIPPQRADCEVGPVMEGSGSRHWRRESVVAGPLGVRRGALRQMTETGNGQLIGKMPALVEGRQAVDLRVPERLRHRVFLYYGFFEGRDGRRTTRIAGGPGFSEIVFVPCEDRPRTVWPGGIRVIGRGPVRLEVVFARNGPPAIRVPLRLGRPVAYQRPSSR